MIAGNSSFCQPVEVLLGKQSVGCAQFNLAIFLHASVCSQSQIHFPAVQGPAGRDYRVSADSLSLMPSAILKNLLRFQERILVYLCIVA